MIYVICGAIIGAVMGLTGAGGALVAIPLFMQFLGMSLKEASVLSLLAVVIASLSNFYHQRKFANYSLATILVVASTVGSFLSNPYKRILPDIAVAIMLTIISIYSLYNVWRPLVVKTEGPGQPHPVLTILIGLFLGLLTTFTGLGGGVLMMPILLSLYRFKQEEAVATSLLAVSLSSLSSLVIQLFDSAQVPLDLGLAYLTGGIMVSAYLLKMLATRLPIQTMVNTRKVVFTIVVVLAIVKIF